MFSRKLALYEYAQIRPVGSVFRSKFGQARDFDVSIYDVLAAEVSKT